MSNEKKIEIPAMPEKYRIMLQLLPEEPAGSKEEQAVRWKLRSAILEAYSAELVNSDAEKEAWTRMVTADERMRRTRSQLRRMAKIAMGYIAE